MFNFTIFCDSGCVALLIVAFVVCVVAHPVVAEVHHGSLSTPISYTKSHHSFSANNEESIVIVLKMSKFSLFT